MALSTKVFIILGTLVGVWSGFVQARAARTEVDPCTPFDEWLGLPRFNYVVDSGLEWNLPPDAELINTVTFKVGGLWVYDSKKENARYYILFRDFEPSGDPPGQHHICTYIDRRN